MPKNETTSKRVASIAGKVNSALKSFPRRHMIYVTGSDGLLAVKTVISVGDVVALAASALTQAADKPKPAKKAKKAKKTRK